MVFSSASTARSAFGITQSSLVQVSCRQPLGTLTVDQNPNGIYVTPESKSPEVNIDLVLSIAVEIPKHQLFRAQNVQLCPGGAIAKNPDAVCGAEIDHEGTLAGLPSRLPAAMRGAFKP